MRAIGVVLVVAFHAHLPGAANGGWVGVDMFFVLSGYLITGQLIAGAALRLGEFWWRRLARLWPALLLTMAFTLMISIAGDLSWTADLAGASYLLSPAEIVKPHLQENHYVGHTWSLAVEMQFYVVWALAVAFLLRTSRQAAVMWLACAGATVSLGLKIALIVSGVPWDAYLFGGSHAEGLLVGAALAASSGSWRAVARRSRDLVVGSALVTLLCVPLASAGSATGQLSGVFAGIMFSAAVITEVRERPDGRVAGFLEVGVLRWLGARSYSLYLWHAPLVLAAQGHPVLGQPASTVLAVVFSLFAAELSYRLVEVPARRWLTARTPARLAGSASDVPGTCFTSTEASRARTASGNRETPRPLQQGRDLGVEVGEPAMPVHNLPQ